jgi:hypothetical protein
MPHATAKASLWPLCSIIRTRFGRKLRVFVTTSQPPCEGVVKVVWLVGCGARVSDSIASMSSGAPRHLFIAGCPRSGTSALAFLLNEHPQLVLGFERFKRVRAQLDPFHFTPAQFFSPVAAETDIRGELLYERLRARWERGSVTAIGDKVPLYTRVLPQLLERFPDGRMVVMVREPVDVAASFRRRAADPQDWWPAGNDHRLAVAMWNEALAAARAAELGGEGERILLLPYEPLLAGEERWLDVLLAFIGLPSTARLRAEHRRLAAGWHARSGGRPGESELLDGYMEAHRDPELQAWAHERMKRHLEHASPPAADGRPTGEEAPLTTQELGERARTSSFSSRCAAPGGGVRRSSRFWRDVWSMPRVSWLAVGSGCGTWSAQGHWACHRVRGSRSSCHTSGRRLAGCT